LLNNAAYAGNIKPQPVTKRQSIVGKRAGDGFSIRVCNHIGRQNIRACGRDGASLFYVKCGTGSADNER
jgi:hypothetical protein